MTRRSRYAMVALSLIFVTRVFAEPQSQKERPRDEPLPEPTKAAQQVPVPRSWFDDLIARFRAPLDVAHHVLRGGENSPASGRVVIGRLKSTKFELLTLTDRKDLRAPVFMRDRVIAVAADGLVAIDPQGAVTAIPAIEGVAVADIARLLGWTKSNQLVVLTKSRHVYFVDLEKHTKSDYDHELTVEDASRLNSYAQTCAEKPDLGTLETGEQVVGLGNKRLDVGLKKGDVWTTNLSKDLDSRRHADPVFSRDCRGVAFIAAD
jgi:hypothetical protein